MAVSEKHSEFFFWGGRGGGRGGRGGGWGEAQKNCFGFVAINCSDNVTTLELFIVVCCFGSEGTNCLKVPEKKQPDFVSRKQKSPELWFALSAKFHVIFL